MTVSIDHRGRRNTARIPRRFQRERPVEPGSNFDRLLNFACAAADPAAVDPASPAK